MTRTPNYRLKDAMVFSGAGNRHNTIELPAGSFVRPISFEYVPKHVLEDPRWRFFNELSEVFVYTSIGIVVIHKDMMRET